MPGPRVRVGGPCRLAVLPPPWPSSASRAQPVTSGSLPAPPTWADAPCRSPRCAGSVTGTGTEGAHWKPAGSGERGAGTAERARGARYKAQTRRAPPIPLGPPRRLTHSGRGRGGGGSCLRLAVKSGSCSCRARASPGPPSSSPPPLALLQARRPPSPPAPEPPSTGLRQPTSTGRGSRNSSGSAADPEVLQPPTARLVGGVNPEEVSSSGGW